jgi:D-alanyl-lipoteichoic acid acyltransferase DltB (MBOAT superfamily)
MLLSPEFGLAFIVFLTIYWLTRRAAPAVQAALAHTSPWQSTPLPTLHLLQQPRILWLLPGFLLYVASTAPKFTLIWLAFTGSQALMFTAFNKAPPLAKKWVAALFILLAAMLLVLGKYYEPVREFGLEHRFLLAELIPPFSLGNEISFSFFCFQTITWCVAWAKPPASGAPFASSWLINGFLPTLTAGPILRAERFLAQLARPMRIRFVEIAFGRICLGLIKKLIIANWLAQQWVDPVFKDPALFTAPELLGAALAYSLQIYFDFSGLSDLVYGISALLGIHIPRNFNQPYLASNLRQFWQRWHISLSSWIRDYIYKPLGGNRHGALWSQIALAIAMLLSGLWHGAGWNFVAWASLHVVGTLAHRAWRGMGSLRLPPFLGWLLTFGWVTLAWVFFRAPSFADALFFLARCVDANAWQAVSGPRGPILAAELWGLGMIAVTAFVTLYFGAQLARWQWRLIKKLGWTISLICWTLLVLATLFLGPSGVPNFIYATF